MRYKVYKHSNAPGKWGVQAIVYEHPLTGWVIETKGAYYIQLKDRFVAVNEDALLDWIVNCWEQVEAVWVGRTISNQEYQDIMSRAHQDKDFAEKTGRVPWERVIDD